MRRLVLITGAVPTGLLTGLVAWALAGGLSIQSEALQTLEAELAAVPSSSPLVRRSSGVSAAALLGAPLFALTTGPGAIREPAIRVDGVALSRRRTVALISIDGRPSEWLGVGDVRDGVTVQSISSSGIEIETGVGSKVVAIGAQTAATSPAAASAGAGTPERAPSGFRSPLEPASAPQAQ